MTPDEHEALSEHIAMWLWHKNMVDCSVKIDELKYTVYLSIKEFINSDTKEFRYGS